jgi:hypothetical protein
VRRAAAVGPRAPLLLCQSREANERPFDGSLDHEKTRNLEDGSAEFVYRGVGATHRAAASEFALAQASHNPNNVIAVLNQFPFHVEALLAMCDFYQATDQVCRQSDLIFSNRVCVARRALSWSRCARRAAAPKFAAVRKHRTTPTSSRCLISSPFMWRRCDL